MVGMIACHNDGYTLEFCLKSLAHVLDAIIVFDDASRPPIREFSEYKNVFQDASPRQLGPGFCRRWVLSRAKELFPDDMDLIMLDADLVLAEYAEDSLRDMVKAGHTTRLGLTDMWADFAHTSQRVQHWESPCYVNLRLGPFKVITSGHYEPRFQNDVRVSRTAHPNGPWPMFFHLRSVKPDWRIIERNMLNPWSEEGQWEGNQKDFIEGIDDKEMHRLAVEYLFTNSGHHMRRYDPATMPPLPLILQNAPQRFEVVYRDGKPFDRIDHGE